MLEGYHKTGNVLPTHADDIKMAWVKDGECYATVYGFYDAGEDDPDTVGFYDRNGVKNAGYDTPPTQWKHD